MAVRFSKPTEYEVTSLGVPSKIAIARGVPTPNDRKQEPSLLLVLEDGVDIEIPAFILENELQILFEHED